MSLIFAALPFIPPALTEENLNKLLEKKKEEAEKEEAAFNGFNNNSNNNHSDPVLSSGGGRGFGFGSTATTTTTAPPPTVGGGGGFSFEATATSTGVTITTTAPPPAVGGGGFGRGRGGGGFGGGGFGRGGGGGFSRGGGGSLAGGVTLGAPNISIPTTNRTQHDAILIRGNLLNQTSPNRDTMRLEVICATSGLFNVLAPRFANHPDGVLRKQMKIISTCDTFQYTNRVNYRVDHSPPQFGGGFRAVGAAGAPGTAQPQVEAVASVDESSFLAHLIRTKLHYIVSFKINSAPQQLIVAALLASERLDEFDFAISKLGDGKHDYHLIELLRHRNHNVRRQVLQFFRNRVASGNPHHLLIHKDPSKPQHSMGGFGGHLDIQHPIEVCAFRGYTQALSMLLELQDELIAIREEQKENRKIEIEDFLKKKHEEAEQERLRQRQQQQQQQVQSGGGFGGGGGGGGFGGSGGGFGGSGGGFGGGRGGGFGGGAPAATTNPAATAGATGTTTTHFGGGGGGLTFAGGGGAAIPHPQQPPAGLFATGAAAQVSIDPDAADPTKRPELYNVRLIDLDLCLSFAVQGGHARTVEFLLSRGARCSAYAKPPHNVLPIEAAAANGSLAVVKLLHRAYVRELEKWNEEHPPGSEKEEEEKQNQDNQQPQLQPHLGGGGGLFGPRAAATHVSPEEEQKKRLEPRKPFRANPLHRGAQHLAIVKYLLSDEDDCNKYYDVNEPEITQPGQKNSRFTGFGASTGRRENSEIPTLPLHHAILSSSRESVAFMLDKGASVTKTGLAGKANALQLGCRTMNIDILRLLVEKGSPKIENLNGALVAAARSGASPIVEYLLKEVKLDPNCIDTSHCSRETPLLACCRKSCDARVLRLLIESGADVNKKSDVDNEKLLRSMMKVFEGAGTNNNNNNNSIAPNNSSGAVDEKKSENDDEKEFDVPATFGSVEVMNAYFNERCCISPLAALFSHDRENPPSSLLSAMKILLFEGKADPNTFVPRPVARDSVSLANSIRDDGRSYHHFMVHTDTFGIQRLPEDDDIDDDDNDDKESESDEKDGEAGSASPHTGRGGGGGLFGARGRGGSSFGAPRVGGFGGPPSHNILPHGQYFIVYTPILQILCCENPTISNQSVQRRFYDHRGLTELSCLELFLDASSTAGLPRLDLSFATQVPNTPFPLVVALPLHKAASFIRDDAVFSRLLDLVSLSHNNNNNTSVIELLMMREKVIYPSSDNSNNNKHPHRHPAVHLISPFRRTIQHGNWKIAHLLCTRFAPGQLACYEKEDVEQFSLYPFSLLSACVAFEESATAWRSPSYDRPRILLFLRLLQEKGANPNLAHVKTGRTILNICCSVRNKSVGIAEFVRSARAACGCDQIKIRTEQDEYEKAQTRSLSKKPSSRSSKRRKLVTKERESHFR